MTYQTLISAQALRDLLGSGQAPVLLLDASHDLFDADLGRRTYEAGHLPGAHFVSMERDMGGPRNGQNGRHPLPARPDVVNWLRQLGATNQHQIVVYDQCEGSFASRVWWTIKWLGHHDVAVLDGGAKAWQAIGGVMTQSKPELATSGDFTDRGESMPTVSYEDLLENLETQKYLVIDARSEDRFRGENETLDPVGGHIPGAISRFYKSNLNPDGTFKSDEQLISEFTAAARGRDASALVMQCGSGVSACHNLLALQKIGFGVSPLYIGSWSEWCARPNAPIATGPA
jgi:thiosulfate/3-mercaptopyruvate sulfurtransferase